MSTDVQASLVIGVLVKKEDFLVEMGRNFVCSYHGHRMQPNWRVCPECGGKKKANVEWENKPLFQKYASEHGLEDDEDAWMWFLNRNDDDLGVFDVREATHCESGESDLLALGYRVGRTRGHRSTSSTATCCNVAELEPLTQKVREAERLFFRENTREVQLFLSVYVSF